MSDIEINSKDYWDKRFQTDWESSLGREQSRYFARLAVEHFPTWFVKIARTNNLTLCDWGCAEGDGTDVLAELLGGEHVSGVDFSEPAIEQARKLYPHVSFHAEDWLMQEQPSSTYDIVFSSNTLEHFHDTAGTLRHVLLRARKCVVLLLPYREFERHPEHHHTFLASNVTIAPTSEFVLVHSSVIDTTTHTPNYWNGSQILLIYARPEFLADASPSLADITVHDETYPDGHERPAVDQRAVIDEQQMQIANLNQAMSERDTRIADLDRRLGERDAQLGQLKTQISDHASQVAALIQELETSRTQASELQQKAAERHAQTIQLRQEMSARASELQSLRNELAAIKNTLGWKYLSALHDARQRLFPPGSRPHHVARFFYRGGRFLARCAHNINGRNIKQFIHYSRHYGPVTATRRMRAYIARTEGFHALQAAPAFDIRERGYADALLAYLRGKKYKGVFVMGSCCMGWHEVFKQRPHHIADYLMDQGYLVICAMNPTYPEDYTECLRQESEHLFIVNFDNRDIWSQVVELLAVESRAPLFYHLVGTEPGTTPNDIQKLKSLGYVVYYDYIDEISRDINPGLSDMCLERHHALLQDEEVLCVASADNLYRSVQEHRSTNALLAPNGVRLEDWVLEDNPPIPDEMKSIVEEGKPIVGYYGNLATWMNFDFIKELSRQRPDLNIVMIGHDYDWGKGAFAQSRIAELPNVHILPPQKYHRLKYFSRFFDIGIIPFREYELTKSVSPVKMFEYMAQGLPIVATGLQECRKYASCLNADDADDFIAKVAQALELKHDSAYQAQLRSDANANTWTARGQAIEAAMRQMAAQVDDKVLSIVVPTYNMAALLPRCLDSMLPPSQLNRLEIIVVNDGSKDNSLEIARDYENRYPGTIRVVDKENGGHGSCINTGIREATGRYFKIVDADDWLEPLALTAHMNFLARTHTDMVVTNYLRTFDDGSGQLVSYTDRLDERTYDIENFYDEILVDNSSLSYAHMHAITYRTNLLRKNDVRITEKSFYVDQEYISLPQPYIENAHFENIILYRYYIGRPGQSVAPDVARKRAPDNYKILMNLVTLLESLPAHASSRAYILNIAFHHTWFYLTHSDDNEVKRDLMHWWQKQSRPLSRELNQNFRIL